MSGREYLERDDLIYIALISVNREALKSSSAKYIAHKERQWEEADKEAEEARRKHAEERAKRKGEKENETT